ncbi:MAG: AmmeMemoRadiSam system radical SAM enzyme [Nitrospira sp.]|nr:AmmeMemoRadiSam system radical SAM enzyme [bacterium]MBL7049518.1 AmmeMemoRadiSam system radical SAM enzyme [Nitrospira sp.]
MKEAMFYKRLEGDNIKCSLCAHCCTVSEGNTGICRVRENQNGNLFSLVYGKLVSSSADPIEKKPLFHFLPSTSSFSIATVGCNFRCMHCQNFEIAHYAQEHNVIPGEYIEPGLVVAAAEKSGCSSISYTYTEPTIFFEYAYDCAVIAHERGIKNIFVSNGYTGPEAVKTIAPYLDAANIDLKGDDGFYRKVCGARLRPVLDTIRLMRELDIWVELTTLLIPGYNDSEESLRGIIDFILSVDFAMPWHISRFHPTYKILDRPVTSIDSLLKARRMGVEAGLRYVYLGNVPGEDGENTYCPECAELLIQRVGYSTECYFNEGKCPKCGEVISGVWK